MTILQKIKSDTPAKVAQWSSIITLLAVLFPYAVETLPTVVSPVTKAWLEWIRNIVIFVAQYFNLTSGKSKFAIPLRKKPR